MRSRQNIKEDFRTANTGYNNYYEIGLVLEVALDIRDLLLKKEKRK